MLNGQLDEVVRQAVEQVKSSLEAQSNSVARRVRFLEVAGRDPRFNFLSEFVHRYLSMSARSDVVDVNADAIGRIHRLAHSFYIDEPAQFANLARLLWLTQSFSRGLRSSRLFQLYKLDGLDDRLSLEELAQVQGFRVTTYECPSLIETLAEFGLGYTMLWAMATQTNPVVLLYGANGTSRNRHLAGLAQEEYRAIFNQRRDLLEVINIPVTEIDIPDGFFYVPKNFVIARGIMELGHGKRDLDEHFINYLIREEGREEGLTRDRNETFFNILKPFLSKKLVPEDYEALKAQLRQPVAELGISALQSEGIHDIADIILNADDYKSQKFGTATFDKKELERRSQIWKKLLPSSFTADVLKYLEKVNKNFRRLGAKQFVEYFMGEVIEIMRPLLVDPTRAYVKFGNETEQYWDECVYKIFGSSELAADAFWLLGDFFDGNRLTGLPSSVPPHSVFISLLYSHFTFPTRREKEMTRAIYTGYGIPRNKLHASVIPLVSDTQEELSAKFSRMARYDPDELSRLVVGAIYSFMNSGDGSPAAQDRFTRNMDALLEAIGALPEAYQKSVSVLDPRSIPEIIDARIRAEQEAMRRKTYQLETDYLSGLISKISEFESSVKEKREILRGKATEAIKQGIKNLDVDLVKAIRLAEGSLSEGYHGAYSSELITGLVNIESDQQINDYKLELLASYFLGFYSVPVRERDSDTRNMVEFLGRISIDSFYDPVADEILRLTQKDTPEIIKQLNLLLGNLSSMNERNAIIAEDPAGYKSKSKKIHSIGFEEYLDSIAETLVRISFRRQRLGEILGQIRTKQYEWENVAEELQQVINSLNNFNDKVTNYYVYGVDRADLADLLQKRFIHKQRIITTSYINPPPPKADDKAKVPRARNVDGASAFYKASGLYPKDEIYMLKTIDDKFNAFEEGYLIEVRRSQPISRVMFPHELQQLPVLRRAIAAWVKYYEGASRYVEGQDNKPPAVPIFLADEPKSLFSISPEQATKFFARILGHLRRELGDAYFEAQHARAQGFPYMSMEATS